MNSITLIQGPGDNGLLLSSASEVPLELIDRDERQPRTEFEEPPLMELAADIGLRGVRQPIELRVVGERFTIVTGERRYRAAQLAGLATIPALLAKPHDEAEPADEGLARLVHQAKENHLREPLSIVDLSLLLRRLRDEHGIKVGDLPAFLQEHHLGTYSRPHCSNLIRITELPDWALAMVREGKLPVNGAKALLRVSRYPEVLELVKKIFDVWLNDDDERVQRMTESDVQNSCIDGMVGAFPFADRGYAKNAPRYDVEAHRDEIGLEEFDVPDGMPVRFITNLETHERLQAENPRPHPKSPAAGFPHIHGKPADDTVEKSDRNLDAGVDALAAPEKAKPAPKSLLDIVNEERVRGYLVDWWRWFIRELPVDREPETWGKRDGKAFPALTYRETKEAVLQWLMFNAPRNQDEATYMPSSHCELQQAASGAAKEHKHEDLRAFLREPAGADALDDLFRRAVQAMQEVPLIQLVAALGLKLEDCWTMDSDYLRMHQTATLEATVQKMNGHHLVGSAEKKSVDPEWSKATRKLGDMRAYCLERAARWHDEKRVPAELTKVWKAACKAVQS